MARRQHTALAALAETPTLHLVHVPDETASAATRRYGVGIEILYHGRCARFYADGDEPETVLLGLAYSALGKLEEWKRYRRDPDCKQRLLIDRRGGTRWWPRSMERTA